MKAIIFLKRYGLYNPKDVATFPEAAADRLIAAKVAAPHAPAPVARTQRTPAKVLRK